MRLEKTLSHLYLSLPSMFSSSKKATFFLQLVLFFTLTLDFVLALPLLKKKYNVIISVTCKFSKRVTLIKDVDTYSVKKWAHVFLNRLDLIN